MLTQIQQNVTLIIQVFVSIKVEQKVNKQTYIVENNYLIYF